MKKISLLFLLMAYSTSRTISNCFCATRQSGVSLQYKIFEEKQPEGPKLAVVKDEMVELIAKYNQYVSQLNKQSPELPRLPKMTAKHWSNEYLPVHSMTDAGAVMKNEQLTVQIGGVQWFFTYYLQNASARSFQLKFTDTQDSRAAGDALVKRYTLSHYFGNQFEHDLCRNFVIYTNKLIQKHFTPHRIYTSVYPSFSSRLLDSHSNCKSLTFVSVKAIPPTLKSAKDIAGLVIFGKDPNRPKPVAKAKKFKVRRRNTMVVIPKNSPYFNVPYIRGDYKLKRPKKKIAKKPKFDHIKGGNTKKPTFKDILIDDKRIHAKGKDNEIKSLVYPKGKDFDIEKNGPKIKNKDSEGQPLTYPSMKDWVIESKNDKYFGLEFPSKKDRIIKNKDGIFEDLDTPPSVRDWQYSKGESFDDSKLSVRTQKNLDDEETEEYESGLNQYDEDEEDFDEEEDDDEEFDDDKDHNPDQREKEPITKPTAKTLKEKNIKNLEQSGINVVQAKEAAKNIISSEAVGCDTEVDSELMKKDGLINQEAKHGSKTVLFRVQQSEPINLNECKLLGKELNFQKGIEEVMKWSQKSQRQLTEKEAKVIFQWELERFHRLKSFVEELYRLVSLSNSKIEIFDDRIELVIYDDLSITVNYKGEDQTRNFVQSAQSKKKICYNKNVIMVVEKVKEKDIVVEIDILSEDNGKAKFDALVYGSRIDQVDPELIDIELDKYIEMHKQYYNLNGSAKPNKVIEKRVII